MLGLCLVHYNWGFVEYVATLSSRLQSGPCLVSLYPHPIFIPTQSIAPPSPGDDLNDWKFWDDKNHGWKPRQTDRKHKESRNDSHNGGESWQRDREPQQDGDQQAQVEQFISKWNLDRSASEILRLLPAENQLRVMKGVDLTNARSAAAMVKSLCSNERREEDFSTFLC